MKKCVVVCLQNCKIKNVLFSKNITKRTKNRRHEKINNVNVRFLVLSVYKVQNRLLSKIPASDCVSAWKSTNKANEPPRFPQWKPGRFLHCNLQGKAEIVETSFLYGRTSKLSNRIAIIDRQKGINAIKGECTMKKIWMFLLGAAFAAELFLVVCMASRSASPRQVMYTFKDDVWDVIYRLNRRWNLWEKHLAFWRMDRQAVHLFSYTGVVQKRQKFFCNSVKRQNFTQRIAAIVVLCYNEQRRRMNCV